MAKEGKKQELQEDQPTRGLNALEEMERRFENCFSRGWLRPHHWELPSWGELATPFEGKIPSVDIIERDDDLIVKAEVPGVDKKDLDISITENTVTIKGSTSHEEKEEKGDFYRCEISRGAYSRTLALPSSVNADKAKATFKDGMLELTLPKVEKSKRQKIEVE